MIIQHRYSINKQLYLKFHFKKIKLKSFDVSDSVKYLLLLKAKMKCKLSDAIDRCAIKKKVNNNFCVALSKKWRDPKQSRDVRVNK